MASVKRISLHGRDFARIAKLAAEASGEKTDARSVNAAAHLPRLDVALPDVENLLKKTGKPYKIDEAHKTITLDGEVIKYG